MSTQKNEHNPDGLRPETVGKGWRLLTKGEVQEIGDEWWYGGEWCPVHQDNVGRHYEFTTTRRRITPPTDTTGEPDPNCERCFGFGWIRRPAEGVRCDCCPDTTGSGREGETPTPETDAIIKRSAVYSEDAIAFLDYIDLAKRLERQRDAAIAQVEALRRDGERLDWLEKNAVKELKIDNDGTYVQLDRWHRKYITAHSWTEPTLRAAIDSAQRQEAE